MKVAAVLAAYALLLALAGPLLARASWTRRAPRWGIAAWQALSLSMLSSLVLAGLALALPALRLSGDLSTLLRECVMALKQQYASPGGALSAAVGAATALAVLGAAGWGVSRALTGAATARRAHRDVLSLTGRSVPGSCGAPLVVEHEALAAYCVPGRGGRIVLTSAALAALPAEELAAVMAHERAHLAGRHHLVLAAAHGLAATFTAVPLLRVAAPQIAVLVEMLADDRALRETEGLTVAAALLRLGASPSRSVLPAAVLGATTTATGDRVRRLLQEPRPLGRSGAALAAAAGLVLIITPLLVLLTPALVLAGSSYCPA